MVPDDLSRENLLSALDGARIAYFDGRLPETALVIAQEVIFICVSSSFLDTSSIEPILILPFELV